MCHACPAVELGRLVIDHEGTDLPRREVEEIFNRSLIIGETLADMLPATTLRLRIPCHNEFNELVVGFTSYKLWLDNIAKRSRLDLSDAKLKLTDQYFRTFNPNTSCVANLIWGIESSLQAVSEGIASQKF